VSDSILEPGLVRADQEGVRDVLGDPDALARAAGVTDPAALDAARAAVSRVGEAEVALRQAYADRDAAVRAAAGANPGLPVAALARALGLHPSTVRAALR
jgi:hypothetical protein